MSNESSNGLNDAFDLIEYSKTVESTVASYEDLERDSTPNFLNFLSGLRERLEKVNSKKSKKKSKKKIFIVLGTGGTFQSAKTDKGYAPTGTLKESFRALGLPEDPSVHLELCDLMKLDSSQMRVEHWRYLAERIRELEEFASDAYDSVIVTHGTDTMAKGAAYLSFMLKGFPKSIIFTGSQEPARVSGTDAKDQMERTITTAKIATDVNRRVCEVMVCCGLKVTRGTWAKKNGDKTSNAFGPWNQPTQDFDATDWNTAVRDGTLHRLAPALLDFGTGKGRGSLEFADHVIDFSHKGPFEPFTQISGEADIIPASLSNLNPEAFAAHVIGQNVSVVTQLGSATADDRLVAIAMEAARQGKLVLFKSPFADSSVPVGTYASGAAVSEVIASIQRRLPILNTSEATFEAKSHFVCARLGIQPEKNVQGLGACYSPNAQRAFYDAMEQNLVRELV